MIMLEKALFFVLGLLASGVGTFFMMNNQILGLEGKVLVLEERIRDIPNGKTLNSMLESILKKLSTERIPVANGHISNNKSDRPMIVVGFCNGTANSKDIEAKIGENTEQLRLVASESGKDRSNVTFVVPPKWHYSMSWGSVAGIGCFFEAWRI